MPMMKAVVMHEPGGPDVLKVVDMPIPDAKPGEVLIRVKAFGLNRSELFTRRGDSPGIRFPRVLGIEAVGTVARAPGQEFREGQTVATAMGGMGRQFDGGYAEYTVVPAAQVQAVDTNIGWDVLGALPEMMQTAWGSLHVALRLERGDRLLIRGGTTSVGLAAAGLAKIKGAHVAATTRNGGSADLLRRNGADDVLIDDGALAAQPGAPRFDKVLELIGVTTLADSLRCARRGGIVCMTGIVGNKWSFDDFAPMDTIPTAVALTTYSGGPDEFMQTPLQRIVHDIGAGALHVPVGPVFRLADIVEAHRCMEENRAGGKIVVLT